MSGQICTPINTFSAGCASDIPILSQDHALWGVLEQIDAVGDGLMRVVVSARAFLVDESIGLQLTGLLGRRVSVAHIGSQWRAGAWHP